MNAMGIEEREDLKIRDGKTLHGRGRIQIARSMQRYLEERLHELKQWG